MLSAATCLTSWSTRTPTATPASASSSSDATTMGGGKRERTRYARYAKATFRKDRHL